VRARYKNREERCEPVTFRVGPDMLQVAKLKQSEVPTCLGKLALV
jgi:hypothetical protein